MKTIESLSLSIILGIVIVLLFIELDKQKEQVEPRSYQIQINSDSTAVLYDGNKIAGRFKFIRTQLDTVIMNDNL